MAQVRPTHIASPLKVTHLAVEMWPSLKDSQKTNSPPQRILGPVVYYRLLGIVILWWVNYTAQNVLRGRMCFEDNMCTQPMLEASSVNQNGIQLTLAEVGRVSHGLWREIVPGYHVCGCLSKGRQLHPSWIPYQKLSLGLILRIEEKGHVSYKGSQHFGEIRHIRHSIRTEWLLELQGSFQGYQMTA